MLRSGALPASEVPALARLCAHPDEPVREAALLLLLHPPIDDELSHVIDLIVSGGVRLPLMPEEVRLALFELAYDFIAVCGGLPGQSPLRTALARILHPCPKNAVRHALAGRHRLDELGISFLRRLSTAFSRKHPLAVKSKLRTFIQRCRHHQPGWAAPTAADLRPLRHNPRTDRIHRLTEGRWLRVCRAVTAPSHSAGDASATSTYRLARSYWGGYGPESIRYLGRLIQLQAREIAAQRDLARRVGAHTGRVVLSLHNATVAAMGGWGFDPLAESFRDEKHRQAFVEEVLEEESLLARLEPRSESALDDIQRLRMERLVQPLLRQAMRQMDVRCRLDHRLCAEAQRFRETAARFAADAGLCALADSNRHTLPGAVAPHQRTDPGDLVRWAGDQLHRWKPGFLRLAALLSRGQAMIDRGEISSFTVPWIDKFFISSRRDKDVAYLPAVIRWMEDRGIRPLALFWEDTAHASRPSLQLGLEQMKAASARFRGIGVFSSDGSKRTEAERIIIEEHAATSLFALRPRDDGHLSQSFHQLLRDHDPRIFTTYDSAWKDNLAFLYCGTQVSSLLSPQTEMESYAPWVLVGGGKHPFGAWLRRELRKLLQGDLVPERGDFWRSYAAWAHLE